MENIEAVFISHWRNRMIGKCILDQETEDNKSNCPLRNCVHWSLVLITIFQFQGSTSNVRKANVTKGGITLSVLSPYCRFLSIWCQIFWELHHFLRPRGAERRVTTGLTVSGRCPKTVNLFNKAHQHMRGTNCTKFTGIWSFYVTAWLSWTHTWHKANKHFFSMFFFQEQTTCVWLDGHRVDACKDVAKSHQEVWHRRHPRNLSARCRMPPWCHSNLPAAPRACDRSSPPHYDSSANVLDETSPCQCEGSVTQQSHWWTTNRLLLKCYFGKCCRGDQEGDYFLFFSF